MTEAVYGIISLAVMLRKEAPYSAILEIIEELNEMLDAKEQSLTDMQKHLVQLNNVIQSAVDNPTDTAALIKDDYELASSKLGDAVDRLVALESSMTNSQAIFVQKELDGAITNIQAAEALISPDTDVNVLDVATAAANGALPTQYLTDAQRKLSVYSVIPLSLQIECELLAVERNTRRINNYLAQLDTVIPNYEEA
ncbi:MAG: hypothetical protein GWN86_03760, partial [Desulfobacterales bacterium]|nr:hypothetical protein [Desulfobacterales bacterium]